MLGGATSSEGLVVSFVGVDAEVLSATDTQVVVRTREGTPSQGNIMITSNTGAYSVLVNGFAFLNPGNITSVEPSSGQFQTWVTIKGERLFGGGEHVAHAYLDGVEASIMTATTQQVIVRAGYSTSSKNDGSVVLVADSGATITSESGFNYLPEATIDSIRPSKGVFGTRIAVRGSGLLSGGQAIETFTIANLTASITEANSTYILAEAADLGREAVVDIVIEANTGGTKEILSAFTYLSPPAPDGPPQPSSGQAGTLITVCADGITGGGDRLTNVQIGDVSAPIVSQTDRCVTFETPEL